MKKFLSMIMIAAALVIAGCSEDDESYNADEAVSTYVPSTNPNVASIKMNYTDKSKREHSWEYNFQYDIHNRIKQLDMKIATYQKIESVIASKYYALNVTSTAYYYFEKYNTLKVRLYVDTEYPKRPDENESYAITQYGHFNNEGLLDNFGPFGCEYSGLQLVNAYLDNGRTYRFARDRNVNITGYQCINADTIEVSYSDYYDYTNIRNKTAFDFAAFVGNMVLERELPENPQWPYAHYQLGAFGMLGVCGTNLPQGEWKFNSSGLPVDYITPEGYHLAISYVE